MYFDTKVPVTTAISSIGIGILLFLATLGFSISLFMTRTMIVMADIVTAARLTVKIVLKIST